jgi:hypothetical protein
VTKPVNSLNALINGHVAPISTETHNLLRNSIIGAGGILRPLSDVLFQTTEGYLRVSVKVFKHQEIIEGYIILQKILF